MDLFRRHVAIPTDHGSWAFLFGPLLIGLVAGGRWTTPSLYLVIAALAGFLARQPITLIVKIASGRRPRDELPAAVFWTGVYSLLGAIHLAGLVLRGHGALLVLAVPGAAVFAWYLLLVARRAERRQMIVEILATGVLALSAPAAMWVGAGQADPAGWLLWVLLWAHSAAAIVYAYLRLAQRRLDRPPDGATSLRMGRRALILSAANLAATIGAGAAGLIPRWLFVPYALQALEVVRGIFRPAVGLRPSAIGRRLLALDIVFILLFVLLWTGCAPPPDVPRPDTTGAEPAVVEAIDRARGSVEREPRSAPAWGKLGMTLDAHDFVAEARACYIEAGRLDPSDPLWPYLSSFCAPDGAPDVAVADLERARGLRPSDPFINLRLGETLLDGEEPDRAREAFEAVLAAGVEDARALTGLARIAETRGETERARELLDRARQADPAHRPALTMLSRLLARQGDMDGAREIATLAEGVEDRRPPPDPYREKVIATGASALHLAIRGSSHLRAGRLDEAIDALGRALAVRPELNQARIELGQALVLAGRAGEGVGTLRAAVEREPGDLAAKRSLAAALAATGDPEGSVALCRQVLAERPGDEALRLHTAGLLLQTGRAGESLALVEEGAARPDPGPALLRVLARLLATLPDPVLRDGPRALTLAETLCAEYADAASLTVLAAAYAETGRFDDALGALDRADAAARAEEYDAAARGERQAWRALFTSRRPARLPPP